MWVRGKATGLTSEAILKAGGGVCEKGKLVL